MGKLNIAIAGGSCTGKSTLAASLFAHVKISGLEYDLMTEEHRKLRKEFGNYRSPFDRFYMWRQQDREEQRSNAADGFITDAPLFNFYIGARLNAAEPRDELAVRELLRMCLEVQDRYALIVVADDFDEIPYRKDNGRRDSRENALRRHGLTRSFVGHFWPERLLLVKGPTPERVLQVMERLQRMQHA